MYKLTKLFTSFGLYWQYSLDTILTHVFVITFLQSGYAATAAILMSLDSVFKVAFSVITARVTANIQMHSVARLARD